MEYTISKDRMIEVVGAVIKKYYPEFNEKDARVSTLSDGDNTYLLYYHKSHKGWFAQYYIWKKELVMWVPISLKLKSIFGEELMEYVIDWFNKEFDQDAEFVTF